MDFAACYKIVYGEEGGYANEPTDSGGETYRGISRVHNPTWAGWVYIDRMKAFKGRIPRYTVIPEAEECAKSFLKIRYWDYPKIEQYAPQLRLVLFDTYVNAGLNAFGILAAAMGITAFRPHYIHLIERVIVIRFDAKGNTAFWNDSYFIEHSKAVTAEKYTEQRKLYYYSIGKGVNAANLNGWLDRADRILRESKK